MSSATPHPQKCLPLLRHNSTWKGLPALTALLQQRPETSQRAAETPQTERRFLTTSLGKPLGGQLQGISTPHSRHPPNPRHEPKTVFSPHPRSPSLGCAELSGHH